MPDAHSAGYLPDPRGAQLSAWMQACEELGALAENATVSRASIDDATRVLAAEARGILAADPTVRQTLVDFILASRIRSFPFAELSRGLGHDLVVAYAFPPSPDTSAIVAARRVRQTGRVVDVVSCDLQNGIDLGTRSLTAGFVDRHVILPGPASYGDWKHINSFVTEGLSAVEAWVEQGREYENLYSRSMWPASHLLAAMLKLRMPHLRWTAEFSDPMTRTIRGNTRFDPTPRRARHLLELRRGLKRARIPRPQTNNLWEWVEHITFALADDIIFTNSNQQEYMLNGTHFPELRQRAARVGRVCPHPIPSQPFYELRQSDYRLDHSVLNIAYFGRFYSNRGISDLIEAIADLPPAERDRVHLHIFSNEPDGVSDQARRAGHALPISSNPYIAYLDFLNLTRRMDLLVVNDTNTRSAHPINPYLPSKLSDYLGSGTPIWAICEPGSALSRTPLQFQSRLGDAPGARRVVQAAILAREARMPVPE